MSASTISLKAFCTTVGVDRKLHKAIDDGSIETVVTLLDTGASVNCYIEGLTPMARAISGEHRSIAQKLLRYKPDVHQGRRTFSRDLCDKTAAPWQLYHSHREMIDQHLPLLLLAVMQGYPDIAESLLQQGADVNVTGEYQTTLNHTYRE